MLSKRNNRSTRTLILIMIVLVSVALLTAKLHYSRINEGVDPRVVPARLAYEQYSQKVMENDYLTVLIVLDSISDIYDNIPYYQNSYEPGVIHINKGATYLTLGLHIDSLRIVENLGDLGNYTKAGFLNLAEEELNTGITLYKNWLDEYKNIEPEALQSYIKEDFLSGLKSHSIEEQNYFLETRVKEIETAQWETDRRLSVAYTNLGLIFYHRNNFNRAAELFKSALDLWEDNLNAENNLNSMLGRPLIKRNFIQKLFPKERETTDTR